MSAKPFLRLAFPALALAAMTAAALADPVLRAEISVTGPIVTAGDMFEEAGELAGAALFRAPAPGTTGTVSLEAVRAAAERVGLADIDTAGLAGVRVTRPGVDVDLPLLRGLIAADLAERGVLGEAMSVELALSAPLGRLSAEAAAEPVRLDTLRYQPGATGFTARFIVAGHDRPLDLTGRLELMVEAPHLVRAMSGGAVLRPDDLEMRPIPVHFADAGGVLTLEAAVGQALQRQSRAGMLVRPGDVAAPQLIARNDIVTVHLRSGALTLTVRGQALNAAGAGESVAVLNLASNRVIHGIAVGSGSVELTRPDLDVAGL